MITQKQAHKRATQVVTKSTNLACVCQAIEIAAEKGKYSIIVDDYLSDEEKYFLREIKGYTVRDCGLFRLSPKISIEW